MTTENSQQTPFANVPEGSPSDPTAQVDQSSGVPAGSGTLEPGEQPVRIFADTPLKDVAAQLGAPNSPAALYEPVAPIRPEKRRTLSTRAVATIAGVGVAVAGGAGGVVWALTRPQSSFVQAGVENSAGAVPGTATTPKPTASASPSHSTSPSEIASVSASPTPEKTVAAPAELPTPESVKKYDTMSAAELAALTIQERLTYNSWCQRDMDYYVSVWNQYTPVSGNHDYDIYPAVIDTTLTDQQILAVAAFNNRQSLAHIVPGTETKLDVDKIERCATALFLDPNNSATYKTIVDAATAAKDAPLPLRDGIAIDSVHNRFPTAKVTNSTELKPLTTAYGEFPSKTLTSNDVQTGEAYKMTVVFVPYTDYNGVAKTAIVQLN